MEEGILFTIKKMLGLDAAYAPFDTDIIVLINSAIMTLTQANVGPKTGFRISGMDETWGDFLTNATMLEAAKEYIYLKVRMIFDPPASSVAMGAMEKTVDELLWRLIAQSESVETFSFVTSGEETEPSE